MVWNFLTDHVTGKSPLRGAGWYKFLIPWILLLISLFLWAEKILSLHLSCTLLCFGNLNHMRDLNTNPAAHGYYTFHFTCQFLCLLILFIVFHTFLNLKISNTKCILKDCSIYPFPKFHNSSLIFMQPSFRILFRFVHFHFKL
jgi:hypothetical protein